MTLDEYQAAALQTASPDVDLMYALAKLCIEAGEALQLHCKEYYHGKSYDWREMQEELGDVLWYVALAARERGLSLEAIADRNIAKLRARHGDTYNAAHYTGEAA